MVEALSKTGEWGLLSGQSARLTIERLWVQIPAGAVG